MNLNKAKYVEALDYFKQSLIILKKVFTSDEHPKVVKCLQNIASTLIGIGDVASNKGEYDDALQCFQQAFDIWQQVYGPALSNDQVEVGNVLNKIGVFLM